MFEGDNQEFPVVTPPHTLRRFMAHYELFNKVVNKPGDIVDIGVGVGGSTWAFAAMCDAFSPGKRVYGFDTFTGFPRVSPEDGGHSYVGVGKLNMQPLLTAQFYSCLHLIKGDIVETVPQFVAAHPNLRIALLNLDADLYLPTKTALECFEPMVVPSGIIIVDEYDLHNVFPGERAAVDEYYSRTKGCAPFVYRFPWCKNPSGYIVKRG